MSFPEYVLQDARYFSDFPVYLSGFGKDIAVIAVSEEYRDSMEHSLADHIEGLDRALEKAVILLEEKAGS